MFFNLSRLTELQLPLNGTVSLVIIRDDLRLIMIWKDIYYNHHILGVRLYQRQTCSSPLREP